MPEQSRKCSSLSWKQGCGMGMRLRCACKWGNVPHLFVERWIADFKLLWKDATSSEERCVVMHPRNLWAALYDLPWGFVYRCEMGNRMKLQGSVQHIVWKYPWQEGRRLAGVNTCSISVFSAKGVPFWVNKLKRSQLFIICNIFEKISIKEKMTCQNYSGDLPCRHFIL